MIEGNLLSSHAVVNGYRDPVKQPEDFLIDWERAGIGLNNPSAGLEYQVWQLQVREAKTDPGQFDFFISAPNHAESILFRYPNVTEAALSFDQNMRPFVAFMASGKAYMYWYDSATASQSITALPDGITSPRCTIDEKRRWNSAFSDNVLAYIRNGWLCVRYQRDRYTVEYPLCETGPDAQLVSMATTRSLRVQWRIRRFSAPTDARHTVQRDPLLADVVHDLYRRAGVPVERINVTHLYAQPVGGFKVGIEGGADTMIESLRSAYFFDPAEWDGQLHATPRGQNAPVTHIPASALIARDDGPLTITRVQEAELLRRVNVTALDSDIDFLPNSQSATRRSHTVAARAERSFELPITTNADEQATIAARTLKASWGQLHRFSFELPLTWSYLTPTDVITLTDAENRHWRMRIESIEEDAGRLLIDAVDDVPWAYQVQAHGATSSVPIDDHHGSPGLSEVVVLNIPLLHNAEAAHDTLGYYLAVMGWGQSWRGAELEISLDGGTHSAYEMAISANSVIGTLVNDFSPTDTTFTVQLPVPLTQLGQRLPTSTDAAGLAAFANQIAVEHDDGTWEILQFQTVTPIDSATLALSDLNRGRYDTSIVPIEDGMKVVFLSQAVEFFPLPDSLIGLDLHLRAISHGEPDPDSVEWDDFPAPAFIESQREWTPLDVQASRDPATDDVTVTWQPRPRLDLGTAPRHSQHFTGYRLDWSDGTTETVSDPQATSHTRPNVPSNTSVTVTGLNALTGAGRSSISVTS